MTSLLSTLSEWADRILGLHIPPGELGFAHMAARTYVMESAAYLTAGIADRGVKDISIEAAICKVMGSETLWYVVCARTPRVR